MKTLIAYGTGTGTTKELSETLSKKIKGDVTVINLKEQKNINLSDFETIIIGGSIRAGQMQSEVRSFCRNNLNELKQKNVGLFICCEARKAQII
jgi:menaquinone-dependent protoporphyrinogen oxidase